jgi:hypothetical protein
MTKLGGGLKSGIRQQDLTRRLDDNLSSSDFERARRGTRFRKHVKSLSEQVFYALIGVALIFCFVRFTVQTFFSNKIHTVLAPLLGKNTSVVEQVLTGKSQDDLKDEDNPDADDASKTEQTPPKPQPKKHQHRHAHHK